jgi:site-specific recombinase XerD
MTVSEVLDNHMKYIQITKAKGTYNFHIGNVKRMKEYFKDEDAYKMNREKVLNFVVYLRKKNEKISNASINKYVQLLYRALRDECNIKINLDKLSENKKMIKIVNNHTVSKIFDYYGSSYYPEHLRNNLMFRLLLDTVIIISELLYLKVSNININDNSILITETKTKVERIVFYTEATSNLLNKYIIRENIHDYIFIDLITRKPIKLDRIQKICQNLQKSLNINDSVSPHKWRHTFATNFINHNGNLEVLRTLLGHTSITTTQRYLHVNTQKIKR